MSQAIAYHPSVPLHLQIQRVLRGKIESGEWEADGPIPTEMELAKRFGVSRTTIRGALGVLTRDGLIMRHRGRGSFVRPSRPQSDAPVMVSNLILGYRAEIRVIKVETVPAPGHIVEALGVQRGSLVTRFVRVEMVGGAPLAVVVNYMREELGRRIKPRALTKLSMLEFLRDRLGLRLGVIRQALEARLPDEEVAGLLQSDLTQPVLFLRLVVTGVDARPVEVSDTCYRADRYRYEVEMRLSPRRGRQPGGNGARRTARRGDR